MKQQAGFRFGQMSLSAMALLVFTLFLLSSFHEVRGGCSRFGHSCFGAHGKRSELPNSLDFGQAGVDVGGGFGQIPRAPADFYPPSTGGANVRVSPYLLEWLIAAHRAEAGRGSGGTGEGGSKEDQLLASEMRKK